MGQGHESRSLRSFCLTKASTSDSADRCRPSTLPLPGPARTQLRAGPGSSLRLVEHAGLGQDPPYNSTQSHRGHRDHREAPPHLSLRARRRPTVAISFTSRPHYPLRAFCDRRPLPRSYNPCHPSNPWPSVRVPPRRPSAMHPYTASPGASGLSSIYMRGSLHSKPLTRNPKTRDKGCSVDGCCSIEPDCAVFEWGGRLEAWGFIHHEVTKRPTLQLNTETHRALPRTHPKANPYHLARLLVCEHTSGVELTLW